MDNYFKVPFANAGDKTAIPDDTQANGSVSYTAGYGLDYQKQRGVDADAKAIERDKMNSLLFKTTAAIQAMQTFGGASAFITAADNGGTAYSYSKGARVSLSGVVYESLTNANTTTPPGANWQIVNWADVVAFLDARYVNLAGDTMTGALAGKVGLPNIGNTNHAGFVFDSDTGIFSGGDGDLRFATNGIARQVIGSTGTQFVNSSGQTIASMGEQFLGIASFGGSSRISMGPGHYLTVSDSGSQAGIYNGSTWASWFVNTPSAVAAAQESVTAEWVRRYANTSTPGVVDIGDVRIVRGSFLVGDPPAYPSESTGTLTFPASFAATPVVTFGAYGDARYAWLSIIGDARANGFDWRCQEPSGTSLVQNYVATYIAIGAKP